MAAGKRFKPTPLKHAETLHYFQKPERQSLVAANGKTLRPNATPSKGSKLTVTMNEYVGDHVTHAKKTSAQGNLTCIFSGPKIATCSDQLSIQGSNITSKTSTVTAGSSVSSYAIGGGTGKYAGARGLITSISVGGTKNSDVSIVVLPAAS